MLGHERESAVGHISMWIRADLWIGVVGIMFSLWLRSPQTSRPLASGRLACCERAGGAR